MEPHITNVGKHLSVDVRKEAGHQVFFVFVFEVTIALQKYITEKVYTSIIIYLKSLKWKQKIWNMNEHYW